MSKAVGLMRLEPAREQRGQILTMVALMSVVLMSMVALAVDVGQIYAARRVLQNAADEAALVAVTKMPSQSQATSAAQASLAANAAGASSQINFPPSISVSPAAGGSYSGNVVEVVVTRNVPHLYAVVFGRTSSPVSARAIAGQQPAVSDAAIVGLDAGNDRAIKVGGSGGTLVSNGGVFSNGGICAYGASSLDVLAPGTIGSVEGVQTGSPCSASSVTGNASQSAQTVGDPFGLISPPSPAPISATYSPPNPPGWKTVGSAPDPDGWIQVEPGWYQSISLQNAKQYKFRSGVYFVRGDINLTAKKVIGVGDWSENANEAFALNEPNATHPWGPVTFYLYGTRVRASR